MIRSYNRIIGKNIKGIDKNTENLIMNYKWPGNIRELQNIIEYAINMTNSEYITVSDLPEGFGMDKNEENTIRNQSEIIEWNNNLRRVFEVEEEVTPIKKLECMEIEKALRRFGKYKNDKELICKSLGISKATLYRKIKEYGIAHDLWS
jgi:transcriptional regulator with PAS, ATPase and Fis domain